MKPLGKTVGLCKPGRCYHCGTSWDANNHMSIPCGECRGMFPVCSKCFEVLDVDRLSYYIRRLVEEWMRQSPIEQAEHLIALGWALSEVRHMKALRESEETARA